MNIIQKIGIGLFLLSLIIFTAVLGLNSYTLNSEKLDHISNEVHRNAIIQEAKKSKESRKKV